MALPVSPVRIEQAMAEAMKLRDLVGDSDPALLADTIEGQTDVFAIVDRLIERVLSDRLLVEAGKARLKRLEAREEMLTDVLQAMLSALGMIRVERSLATLSVVPGRERAEVLDAKAVPEGYWRRAIDMVELLRALKRGPVDGAQIIHGNAYLMVSKR